MPDAARPDDAPDHVLGRRHEHGHGHDAAPAGGGERTRFDEQARDWDDDAKVARSRVVADAVRARVAVGPHTRVLEYGAGTGLTAQFLAEAGVGRDGGFVLAEPSAGMRTVLAEKVADGRLPPDSRVLDLDLATEPAPDLVVDLVVTVMTLHHIDALDTVLAGLADLLATDGTLCVVDLVAEDGSFHAHLDDFHGHDGFDRATLATALASAGLGPPTWDVVHEVDRDGRAYPLFLATAAPAAGDGQPSDVGTTS